MPRIHTGVLELEQLEFSGKLNDNATALRKEIASIKASHSARGILLSGMTITKIAEARVASCRALLEFRLQIRRQNAVSHRELLSDEHLDRLSSECMRVVDGLEKALNANTDVPQLAVPIPCGDYVNPLRALIHREILKLKLEGRIMDASHGQRERDILQAIDDCVREQNRLIFQSDFVGCEMVRSNTPYFRDAAHRREEFTKRLRVLEGQSMVRRITNGEDCAVALSPKGEERLLMSEEQFQAKYSVGHHVSNVFNAPVEQFAQTLGVDSPIQQNRDGNKLDQVLPLIDQLLLEIKRQPSIDADTENEVEHLKLELRKEHPVRERLMGYLDSVKAMAGSATAVIEVVERIRRVFDGVS